MHYRVESEYTHVKDIWTCIIIPIRVMITCTRAVFVRKKA
jgi:hypothetical protein